LTVTGALVGTPAYLAPEQVEGRGAAVGPACDVYALGVILYECLTGKLPFTGWLEEILVQVARDEPPPPRAHRPALDRGLEPTCLRAMAKRTDAGYAGMDELAGALAAYLDGSPAGRSRRPPWRLALAGLGGLAAVGLVLAAVLWPRPKDPET